MLQRASPRGFSESSECSAVEVQWSSSRLGCRWLNGSLSHRPSAGSDPPTSHGLRQRARADHPLLPLCLPPRLTISVSVHRVWLRFALIIAVCSSDSLSGPLCIVCRVVSQRAFAIPRILRRQGRGAGLLLARAASSVPVCCAILRLGFAGCSGRRSSSAPLLPVFLLRFVLQSSISRESDGCHSTFRPPRLRLVMPWRRLRNVRHADNER